MNGLKDRASRRTVEAAGMNTYDGGPIGADDPHPGWIDVTRIPLASFFSTGDAAVDRCMRDVLAELDQPTQVLTAFGNAPSPR
jgi:hypothetical protein